MVGIFSRFSVRGSHRRTQSALDEREALPPTSDAPATAVLQTASSAVPHGIEIAVEFKPVEHPTEPFDTDQPIQCPLPEPSILNDGRIWKERVSSGVSRRAETPVLQEQIPPEAEIPRTKPRQPNRLILPSISAPEHNILKLLEECNASGISFNT
ncbi:cystic fibrosis transmembrane conductance regulator [Perilla frutescens var. frutescens]|nr:cystic fibrosis transmembrane conductance regulator [Perilla frutescens var. frutescens]